MEFAYVQMSRPTNSARWSKRQAASYEDNHLWIIPESEVDAVLFLKQSTRNWPRYRTFTKQLVILPASVSGNPWLEDHHLLLVTLLLFNTVANEVRQLRETALFLVARPSVLQACILNHCSRVLRVSPFIQWFGRMVDVRSQKYSEVF